MATTPPPEPRPAPPPEPPPVEEVWETIRPVHPTSRFPAVRLATRPPLARHLTIRPHPAVKETLR